MQRLFPADNTSLLDKQPALRGEWWFYDGQAIFADGDVGDMDHTGHVLEYLYAEFYEALRQAKHPAVAEIVDILPKEYNDAPMLRGLLNDWADMAYKAKQITEKQCDDSNTFIQRAIGWPKHKWQALFSDDADPRYWAVRYLDWVRCKTDIIEVWAITRKALRTIADGIDIADETIDQKSTFTIEERSTGKLYHNVPLFVIASEKPAAVRGYPVTQFNISKRM